MRFRRYTGLALIALLALSGWAQPAGAATTPEWAQQGYGPGYTNYNPDESQLNASTIGRVELRWNVAADSMSPVCDCAVAVRAGICQ